MRRHLCWCCGKEASAVEECRNGDALQTSSFAGSNGFKMDQELSRVLSKVSEQASSSNSNVEDAASDTNSENRNPQPRIDWVIGLDFGTTYSGFAYARASDDPQINVYYDWPRKGNETEYCKTLTAMYYHREEGDGNLECSSWGYYARSKEMGKGRHGDTPTGVYLTRFKLLLARDLDDPELAASIPPPLTVMSVITDYLRLIGAHALAVVRNHHIGDVFSKDSVQWVVTVPSIWDDNTKQLMKACMVNAELVGARGIDAVQVVLEPEAASFHCHEILRQKREQVSLNTDDKILVADVGGGTVDIVVQEMIGNSQTYKELTESSGGLCGGTFVDEYFMKFLSQKIPCLKDFLKEYPSYNTRLLKDCEEIKCGFGHEMMPDKETKDITLHNKLALKWEAYEEDRGNTLEDSSVVELTEQDLKSIFDPVVDNILSLIAAQLKQVPDIKVMFVVGGFAGSPYLMRRIRARFKGKVPHIVTPPAPGSAIMQGAVSLALHPEAIVSRIAKKTYGTSVILPFEPHLDPPELLKRTNGADYCRNRFDVFVRKGDRVEVDECVTKNYVPHETAQKLMLFDLWSSTEKEPRFTERAGTTKEGDFAVLLPNKYGAEGKLPIFDLSMFFGRSLIQMRAVGNMEGREAGSLVLNVKYCS